MANVVPMQGALLTPGAHILLALIDTPSVTPDTLAYRVSSSLQEVQDWLDVLERTGYITVDRSEVPGRFTVRLPTGDIAALRRLSVREETMALNSASRERSGLTEHDEPHERKAAG